MKDTTKKCTKCGVEKSLTAFKPKPFGLSKLCDTCRKRGREYMRNRPQAGKFVTTPELSKMRPLYIHGVSPEQYNSMLDAQHGTCFICHKTEEGKRLHIDHCHKTGVIRGLLCTRCNQALGCLEDSIENLLRAVEYLERDYSLAVVHRLFCATA